MRFGTYKEGGDLIVVHDAPPPEIKSRSTELLRGGAGDEQQLRAAHSLHSLLIFVFFFFWLLRSEIVEFDPG